MKKIILNKDYLFSLYGGATQDIFFILSDFSKDIPVIKENFISCFKQGDLQLMRHILHNNYPGFAYAGFPEISAQIKKLLESCKSITKMEDIKTEFEELLFTIDQCKKICDTQMMSFSELQICA
jgi:hypothetical protein